MIVITVNLFGDRIILNNGENIIFPYKKAEALFYYLVVNNSATRDELVNMLWGENGEEIAKKNLRNAVYIIKKLFGEEIIISPQRSVLMLNPAIEIHTDLKGFNSENNEQIISAYTGEFLSGFSVKDAELFDEWVLSRRMYYRNLYIKKLYNQLSICIKTGNIERAVEYGELIINTDKYEEKAYRALMKLYYCQNSSNKALDLYNTLKDILKNDLGILPDSKTTSLYNKIIDTRKIDCAHSKKESDYFFYGRKEELSVLESNYVKLINGYPSKSCIIMGEAGIGKTKIKDKFLSEIDHNNLFLIETSCYQAEQAYLLKPWNSVFSQLTDIIGKNDISIPQLWANIISILFPTFSTDTQKPRDNILRDIENINFQGAEEAIIEVLNKISRHKKIILIFEDIHWIDDKSLKLLKSIILSKNRNLMVIATSRNEFNKEINNFICSLIKYDVASKIFVDRLSPEQAAEFMCSALPDFDFTEELHTKLFKETEGNTFFIVEFLNNIVDKKEIGRLSPKAYDILKTRFLNLSHECKNVLDTLSVFIGKGNFNTLKYTCDMDEFELMDILDELKNRYIIKETESNNDIAFDFTHQKLKEFIYSELSPSRKKLLHNKIAKFMERQLKNDYSDTLIYSKLIYHFTNAGSSTDALKYSIMNTDSYLQSSQELFPILVDTVEEEMRYSFINQNEAIKFLNDVENLLNKVKLENGTNQDIAKLEISYLLMKGRYYIKYGEYEEGINIVKKMIRYALFYHDYKNALKGYKLMIYYCIQTFNEVEMEEYIQKSLEIAESYSLHEEEGIILRFKGLLNIFMGNYSEAEYFLKQSIQIFEMLNLSGSKYTLSIAAAYNYLGEIRRHNKKFDEAIEYYDIAINMCDKIKVLRGMTTFNKNAGQAAYEVGDYGKAEIYLQRAAKLSETLDSIWGRSTVNAYLSLVLIKANKYDESLVCLKKADIDSKILKIPYELGVLYRVKSEIKNCMESNPKVNSIFYEYLGEPLEHYCKLGISILSNLKGVYEIEFMKNLVKK